MTVDQRFPVTRFKQIRIKESKVMVSYRNQSSFVNAVVSPVLLKYIF